jgi:predicted acylesterase/phospholipase RssA
MQVGMQQALYERGIAPDLLVATSAGALNAAFVASRPQVIDTARELGHVWCELQRERSSACGMPGWRAALHLIDPAALNRQQVAVCRAFGMPEEGLEPPTRGL